RGTTSTCSRLPPARIPCPPPCRPRSTRSRSSSPRGTRWAPSRGKRVERANRQDAKGAKEGYKGNEICVSLYSHLAPLASWRFKKSLRLGGRMAATTATARYREVLRVLVRYGFGFVVGGRFP